MLCSLTDQICSPWFPWNFSCIFLFAFLAYQYFVRVVIHILCCLNSSVLLFISFISLSNILWIKSFICLIKSPLRSLNIYIWLFIFSLFQHLEHFDFEIFGQYLPLFLVPETIYGESGVFRSISLSCFLIFSKFLCYGLPSGRAEKYHHCGDLFH